MNTNLKRWLVAAMAAPCVAGAAPPEMTFTTWGGAYAQAQVKTTVAPFAASSGTKVHVAEYGGGLEQLRKQRAAGQIEWDVVDMTLSDALTACAEGLLEKFDIDTLEPAASGERAQQDYLPGTYTECLAGTNLWSTAITYDRKRFPQGEPRSVVDLFDLQKFPGRRALQKGPEGNLEWALMADGVPAASVYATLATPQGVERAFRKLDTIKPQVVWWESGALPLELITQGEVTMATAFWGRVYALTSKGSSTVRFLWEGQLLNVEGLAIVKGTRNLPAARAFVRHATSPPTMLAMTMAMPYGPTRRSVYPQIDPVMMNVLPTAPWYVKKSLQVDARWWAAHGDEMRRRFAQWLAKAPS